MREILAEVRFALRLLRKSPAVSAASVLSLALGIGATAAVFGLADALLLRPLPALHAPQGLVALVGIETRELAGFRQISWADYLDYAGRRDVVGQLAATATCELTLTGHGPAERLSGQAVAGGYFAVLGLTPALGRLLSAADEHERVAVLGHGLWHRQFGADARVIGSPVTLNGKSFTVVGIAPRGFAGTDLRVRQEVWVPLGVYSELATGILASFSGQQDRVHPWLDVVGRLRPSVSLGAAAAALGATARHLAAAYPGTNATRGIQVLPLAELAFGWGKLPLMRGFVARLMAVTALVLVVAAVNVAGLLLARALSRRREIAVRLSLGASRARLVGQLLIEGLVLAALSAAGGVVAARGGLALLERIALPVPLEVRHLALSGQVLACTLVLSLAACLIFALFPALQTARVEILPALRGGAARGRRAVHVRASEILTGVQVAAAFVFLVATGLLGRTLANLWAVPTGFDPSRVLTANIDLSAARYQGPRVIAFYSELLAALRPLPGVVDVTMVSAVPVLGNELSVRLSVSPEAAAPRDSPPYACHVLVGDHYFQTLRMRVLAGRDFGPQDDAASPGAVVVNETAARDFWPGRQAVGRRLRSLGATPFTVIGVVSDSIYSNRREKRQPVFYLYHPQSAEAVIGNLMAPQMTILVRTASDPRLVLGPFRERVRQLDPALPVFGTSTLEDLLGATVGVERETAILYGSLALAAVVLAMLGLFGTLTRHVAEQTREIGIRMACGAPPGSIRRLVLRRSLGLSLAGVVAGVAAAAAASRLVASQLYGVHVYDPAVWLAVPCALAGMALLVSAPAANRAADIDPVRAMKYD
jgi:predicted permease